MELTKEALQGLEEKHLEQLEAEIIAALVNQTKLSERQAMDVYYKSKLSQQVNDGLYGIQYLSSEYLASDLVINEAELFER
ncbi:MAG: hypothetical protein FWD27_08470 [Coriobacteriia bacterium]|nr:hypothetical protein [Coriobacteriia bacterium]